MSRLLPRKRQSTLEVRHEIYLIYSDQVPYLLFLAMSKDEALKKLKVGMEDEKYKEITSHPSFTCERLEFGALRRILRENLHDISNDAARIVFDGSF